MEGQAGGKYSGTNKDFSTQVLLHAHPWLKELSLPQAEARKAWWQSGNDLTLLKPDLSFRPGCFSSVVLQCGFYPSHSFYSAGYGSYPNHSLIVVL
jgi:hypothetical protein